MMSATNATTSQKPASHSLKSKAPHLADKLYYWSTLGDNGELSEHGKILARY